MHPHMQALLVTGGVAGAHTLHKIVRAARKEQHIIISDAGAASGSGGSPGARHGRRGQHKVAVDAVFLRRLVSILRQ